MKLNSLASAVSISLAALALTACGGSGSSASPAPITQPKPIEPSQPADTNPDKKGKGQGEQSQNGASNQGLAESSSPLLANFDASAISSVSGRHYVRKTDSNFDYAANPTGTNTGSKGIISTITLNQQNPYLSNFLVGKEFGLTNGQATQWGYDYLGEFVRKTPEGKVVKTALQDTVAGPVKVLTVAQAQAATGETTLTIPNLDGRSTIQEANRNNVAVQEGDIKAIPHLFTKNINGDASGQTGLVGYGASTTNAGSIRTGSLKVNYGLAENDATSTGGNTLSTRVFGKNYKDYSSDASSANQYGNSYMALTNGDAVNESTFRSGRSIILKDVQYGRLTANIDALVEDPTSNQDDLIYRAFQKAGTPGTTDLYFYRGTNETTADQIKALGTTGQFEYRGHALVYGINPIASTTSGSNDLPNSFGQSKNISTIGNFVHATYDLGKQNVQGAVYNFINKDLNDPTSAYRYNALIDFSGNVKGNTVIGKAVNNAKQEGSLVASFYGSDARELGGSISSIANGDFGVARWGAVFGAQRQVEEPAPVRRGAINIETSSATVKTQR